MGIFEEVMAQSSRRPAGLFGVLERRSALRVANLRSSRTDIASHSWELDLIPAYGTERLLPHIEALAERSLDHNLFFEPTIATSAWPRLTSLFTPGGCWMACLWETIETTRHLRLFMPLGVISQGFPRKRALAPLANEYMPVGTPLIDRDNAGETCETFLRLIADPQMHLPGLIDFRYMRESSLTFQTLVEAARSLGLKQATSLQHSRAALIADPEVHERLQEQTPRKRARDYARQLRRLEEIGPVQFDCARKENEILDAFERFMTLELRGWKGERGTALYNHKKIAAFSRQIVARLAARNCCEIFTLSVGARTVAALILLGRNGQVMPWKMAFDEKMHSYSPGVHLMRHATESLIARKSFKMADSLATADHWMMNRLWPDQIVITDLAIELRDHPNASSAELVAAKERLTRAKRFAKKLLRRI